MCALDFGCGRPCDRAAQVPAVLADREHEFASDSVRRQICGHSSCDAEMGTHSAKLCRKPGDSTGAGCGGRRSCEQQRQAPAVQSSSSLHTVQKTVEFQSCVVVDVPVLMQRRPGSL